MFPNLQYQIVFSPLAMGPHSSGSKKRTRSGGIRQRRAAADAEQPDASAAASASSSALATWLKEQWAWGKFSPQELQHKERHAGCWLHWCAK